MATQSICAIVAEISSALARCRVYSTVPVYSLLCIAYSRCDEVAAHNATTIRHDPFVRSPARNV